MINGKEDGIVKRKRPADKVVRMLNFGSGLVSACAGLLAVVLILYSGYVLYDSLAIEASAFSANSDMLKYKPSVLSQGVSSGSTLDEVNKDYRAWITVGGTPASPIDYPIVQGKDDLYYASHNALGEMSLTGAIYLAAGNKPDFSNTYNLLYGHHMDNGAMFGSLDQFMDTGYFKSHQTATVTTKDGTVYDVTFFAVATTDAYEKQIYTVGNRLKEVISFLTGSRENDTGIGTKVIIYDTNAAKGAEKVIALSTCANASTNGRLVVFGKMTRRGGATTTTKKDDQVRLTVKYYVGSKKVFLDATAIYQRGGKYYVVSPEYPGYDVEIEIVKGTINEDMTVIVHYYPKEWPLTIRYIYPDGSQAAETYKSTVKTGEEYHVTSPVIDGYTAKILLVKGVMDPGRPTEYTVLYVPKGSRIPDDPTPLGLEETYMQVGVCYE